MMQKKSAIEPTFCMRGLRVYAVVNPRVALAIGKP